MNDVFVGISFDKLFRWGIDGIIYVGDEEVIFGFGVDFVCDGG